MMTTSEPRWLELIRAAAAQTSNAAVARLLGYSRTSVSLALKGAYPGGTAKLAAKALEVLEPPVIADCPYQAKQIPIEVCRELSSRRAPTHNPTLMGQWRACQQCQNKCKGEPQ
ncbi:hypothetical protein ACO0LO_01935 [Undibacterium sp. TJN25]|uniref:hypothetical protein n=1 Tax=Undibacterium sp. TJN25 TaxID=3413056 RepID=UPI003BEFA002